MLEDRNIITIEGPKMGKFKSDHKGQYLLENNTEKELHRNVTITNTKEDGKIITILTVELGIQVCKQHTAILRAPYQWIWVLTEFFLVATSSN